MDPDVFRDFKADHGRNYLSFQDSWNDRMNSFQDAVGGHRTSLTESWASQYSKVFNDYSTRLDETVSWMLDRGIEQDSEQWMRNVNNIQQGQSRALDLLRQGDVYSDLYGVYQQQSETASKAAAFENYLQSLGEVGRSWDFNSRSWWGDNGMQYDHDAEEVYIRNAVDDYYNINDAYSRGVAFLPGGRDRSQWEWLRDAGYGDFTNAGYDEKQTAGRAAFQDLQFAYENSQSGFSGSFDDWIVENYGDVEVASGGSLGDEYEQAQDKTEAAEAATPTEAGKAAASRARRDLEEQRAFSAPTWYA